MPSPELGHQAGTSHQGVFDSHGSVAIASPNRQRHATINHWDRNEITGTNTRTKMCDMHKGLTTLGLSDTVDKRGDKKRSILNFIVNPY